MLKKIAKRVIASFPKNSFKTLNWIEIDKNKTLHNIETIRTYVNNKQVIPVLKANAYGHGIKQIAEILNETTCAFIAVDGYFEASKILDITRHKILVMGYILEENIPHLDFKKCSYVVQDVKTLRALGKTKKPVTIHIELNTGMNRLGLSGDEIKEYTKTLLEFSNLHLEGIMSHLADADNEDESFTLQQVAAFDKSVKRLLDQGFAPTYIHLGQTAGSIKEKSGYTNTVRLGIGLYGINPLTPKDQHYEELQKLQPILEFKSTIIKIISLPKDEPVSYNGIYRTKAPSTIAVMPIGYYEGVPRDLSNRGYFSHEKDAFPIRGRVCMNHTMIDCTKNQLSVGDIVTFVSSDPTMPNSVAALERDFGIFSYSFVTNFSESIRRIIV
jgi:alanine racemase